MSEVEKEITVVNRLGLHARAAGRFRRTAASFKAHIEVQKDSITANAKSLLGLMALEAAPGTKIKIRAKGPDAQKAIDVLAKLVADRFGEKE